MGASAAIAVMRLKEREVRESVGIGETLAVRRLKRRAVIREAAPGLFYFDEDVWQALRSMRRRMALLLAGTLTLVLLLILYGTVTLQ